MEEFPETEVFFQTPVDFLEKSIDDGPAKRMVKGIMSTEKSDHDGESISQKGLDCTYLMKSGYINYDHQRRIVAGVKMPVIIGYPTKLERGDRCHILEGELLQGDPTRSEQMRLAEEMWQLGMGLQKSGIARRLAYSVEGPPPKKRGKKIVEAKVYNVALTHKPVNDECSLEMFMKSLCCGKCSPSHPEYNPAHSCGNKHHEFADGLPHLMHAMEKALESTNSGPVSAERTSPLMRENLDLGLTTALYGDNPCDNHFNPSSGCFHKGISGAYEHMTGCLGHDSTHAHKLLSSLIHGARYDEELFALTKTAGLVGR
jgi:hypothetical protein